MMNRNNCSRMYRTYKNSLLLKMNKSISYRMITIRTNSSSISLNKISNQVKLSLRLILTKFRKWTICKNSYWEIMSNSFNNKWICSARNSSRNNKWSNSYFNWSQFKVPFQIRKFSNRLVNCNHNGKKIRDFLRRIKWSYSNIKNN